MCIPGYDLPGYDLVHLDSAMKPTIHQFRYRGIAFITGMNESECVQLPLKVEQMFVSLELMCKDLISLNSN